MKHLAGLLVKRTRRQKGRKGKSILNAVQKESGTPVRDLSKLIYSVANTNMDVL